MARDRIRVAILGASGYTGAELVRLLAGHRFVEIVALTAERHAGRALGEVFPHLAGLALPPLVRLEEVDFEAVQAVFCCLPHGLTQEVVARLPGHLRIVDLSADFRLRDPAVYQATYGRPHRAPELQREAVYGLSEHYREAIRQARLVANPGCYTTTAELALIPLLREGPLIDPDRIIIDAKSGVSGAGREPRPTSLFCEVAEGFHAYGVATHRHTPEIEQCLADFLGRPLEVIFTPHLVPMNRGILATIYVELVGGTTPETLHAVLAAAYEGEPFVRVLPYGRLPTTREVRGTNLCLVGVHRARVAGRAILVAALDNLVKGASGQALQNFNLQHGLPETEGLPTVALFP